MVPFLGHPALGIVFEEVQGVAKIFVTELATHTCQYRHRNTGEITFFNFLYFPLTRTAATSSLLSPSRTPRTGSAWRRVANQRVAGV